MTNFNAQQIEDLLLHATEPHAQISYDGWLLRFAPGDAKRSGSINAPYASTRPVEQKIERCEANYDGRGLRTIFRVTPFSQPPELDAALEARGYRRFERSLVQALGLSQSITAPTPEGLRFEWPALAPWNEACSILHDRSEDEAFVRLTRLKICKIPSQGLLAWAGNSLVGCGMLMTEGEWAGLFEIMVEDSHRSSGIGTAITAALLSKAASQDSTHAWLSVVADNSPALSLYAKLGFETVYDYWYREPAS